MRYRNLLLAAALAVPLAFAGCSVTETEGFVQNTPAAPVPNGQTASPDTKPTTSTKTVDQPWKDGIFQEGIQVYWHANGEPLESVSMRASSIMDYIVATGANSVGVTFPIYTDGPWPTKVYTDSETPSTDDLAVVIKAAQDRDLRVLLRPSVDEANIMTYDNQWRGSITPQDASEWFDSYTQVLEPYWQLANTFDIEEVSLGVELTSLEEHVQEWSDVEASARSVYSGILSYAVNWSEYVNGSPVGIFAVDAYPKINLTDDASSDQLTAEWVKWLELQPQQTRETISLQEVGIPAQNGKYTRPWSWGDDASLNLSVQANWFEASCKAAKISKMAGIYYWMIDSNIDFQQLDPLTDPAGSFVGRPAEEAMKTCFQ